VGQGDPGGQYQGGIGFFDWEGDMKLHSRRQFLHLAAGAAALPAVSRIAWAQTYPTRPVRIIVAYPTGGPNDFFARLIGQWLSERLGQQFIVEYRAGAGGTIGTEAVVRAPADGYTLLLASTANTIGTSVYDKLKYNFARDIAPIAKIADTTGVMVVHPSVPARSVPDLISYAKANPGKINMASTGSGTFQHVSGELFKMIAGINMTHVPYRGAGPALIDLVGGQVQIMFDSLPSSIEHIRAGKLRPLAVTAAMRSEALPDLPTVGEFLAGYESTGWWGIGAPKSTPAEIVLRLNKEINAGLADPKMKARFSELGGVPAPMSPADFGKIIADETEKWGKVVKFVGIKPE
jgi:tripartite-type tricarboxylate transporter receptor subunit TctC